MKKAILLLLLIFGIGTAYATEYSYWIENDSGQMWIWTKVNISANSTITLYIKKVDGYQPRPDDVFEFFDDFSSGTIDTTKWTNNGISISTTDGMPNPPSAYTNTPRTYMYANAIPNLTEDYIIELYAKTGDLNDFYLYCNSSGAGQMIRLETRSGYSSGFAPTTSWTSWSNPSGIPTASPNVWYHITLTIVGNNATGTIDGVGSETYTITKNGGYIGLQSDGLSAGDYWDLIFIRKYADEEPTVSVEQISTDTWKVTIYNPNAYDLTDFQIKINGTGIVNSVNDSLLITDTFSNATLSFKVISTELKPHIPITINISNYTGNVSKFVINWGDGTTTDLYPPETLANHTYNWENNFKIIVTSYDSQGNVLAINSTTVKVVYNISEIPYKYLIKVANPTSQNYTNYPLRISLDATNFDFLLPKPLGTDIYFRDANGTIYKHFIENYSIADQKATIWVQIPYIAPNSYAEFYLCIDKDGHDRKQYTFDTSTTSPYIIYAVIPQFNTEQNIEFGNITRVSSTTNNYQNCSILILDELGYFKANKHKGTIRVINDKGEEVIYTFNEGYIGGIIQVPASTPDGLLIFQTEDGIMRKIHYNVSKINIILVPNGPFAPVLLKGGNGKKWLIYKNDGSFVTLANDESVVQLAVGGEYDFYIEGNPNPVKKDYMVLGNGDVIYARFVPTYEPNLILTQQIFQNDTVKFTVVTDRNITIEFDYNGTKENVSVGAGTWTFIKPDGTNYTIYVNGQIYKTGTLGGENWGLLGEFPREYPNLARWLGFGIIILVLLAGSFITIYVAVPLAIITALILIRLGWIEFDTLTSSIFILIGLASFAYFYLKRNW
ncbi:DUF2341 domain-containing protein [Methanocaldococcus sp.]